ncbi:hypothetical protein MIND_01240400 [Mycena indigotica]|uniref:Uncharacterized protein n=1 Tax=Mycena indigotica TaxID=2126181 RepID=A0A8H6VXU0_9AGAR|nr:uncharacterized protein MIND_01240400 [Mycena indigotica]KAF7292134.1 hypothetical protein MIND_01240400 [Mycena indigotica]
MAVQSSLLTKAVSNAMQRIAPTFLAGSWDNVGLLLELPAPPSSRVPNRARHHLSATSSAHPIYSLTPAVCDEDIALGAGVVVSYHTPNLLGPQKPHPFHTAPGQPPPLRCQRRVGR